MKATTKTLKRQLRELSGLAHEEELRRALVPLADAFKRWQAGRLGSGALANLIHEFHQGPAKELFDRYNAPIVEAHFQSVDSILRRRRAGGT